MNKLQAAIGQARQFATDGPRVAAVIKSGRKICAIRGYIDHDQPGVRQLFLITPDGRVWLPVRELLRSKIYKDGA